MPAAVEKKKYPGIDFKQEDFKKSEENSTLADFMRKHYLGQPVHCIMARYGYAGVITLVGQDFFVLSNAYAIEDGETGTAERPRVPTECASSVVLAIDAVETVCQPVWAFNNEWSTLDPS